MAQEKGKVGSLFFGMTLSTNDFKKKLKEARKATDKAGKAIIETFSKVGAAGSILGLGLAGLGASMAFLTKETAESVNEQNILAQSLGATTAEIEGLILAGNRFAISQDMLIDKMREAGGVNAFKDIAEQVKTAGSASAQLAKAQELLGNEGLKLLPILQLGASGLDKMEEKALALGLALPTDKVAKLTIAWGTYEGMIETIAGGQRKLAAELALPMAEMLVGFKLLSKEVIDRALPIVKQWGKFLIDIMPKVLNGIFSITTGFITWFDASMSGIQLITEALFGMGSAAGSNISVFETMGDILATLPNLVLKTLKLIGAGIATTFQTVGNLIMRPLMEAIFFAVGLVDKLLRKIPGVDGIKGLDNLKIGMRDLFTINPKELFNRLIEEGGLFDTETLDKENEAIIQKRVDNENKFAKDLEKNRKSMMDSLAKLTKDLGRPQIEMTEALDDDIFSKLRDGMDSLKKNLEEPAKRSLQAIGLITSGSQEEARLLNAQNDKNLQIQQKQLNEAIKLNRNFGNIGIA